ncbi:MAG: heavy-metal-associated domain-containing protein [Candidatus Peribacteraceae bacterium]|nr:heavy-metal-associated domain-containing protein [Candidatus Peribacteraceae bacterium]
MQTTVSIPGIHCDACGKLIKSVSGDFPEITDIAVNLTTKTVTLTHADDFALDDWTKEIEGLGETYKVQRLS